MYNGPSADYKIKVIPVVGSNSLLPPSLSALISPFDFGLETTQKDF